MNKPIGTKIMMYLVVAAVLAIALFLFHKSQAGQTKVSEFGKY